MKTIAALTGGLAGAAALTLIHEIVKTVDPDAPRMDLLGMEALSKSLSFANVKQPGEDTLFNVTMAGDLLSNTLYYSLIGVGDPKRASQRGILLGLAAGLGAVYFPGLVGLSEKPAKRTNKTKAMTITWYLAGGLVAAAVVSAFYSNNNGRAYRKRF